MTARVLVTRPSGTWPSLSARFAGTPVQIQMSETTAQVEPLDRWPGEDAIDRLAGYDWLVVTSARGVSALLSRLADRGMTALPQRLSVAAVGPATAAALSASGHRVDVVAANAHSEGLAAELAPRLGAGVRVIVIRPEGTQSPFAAALRGAGATVDEAPLYRTIASESASALADAAIAGDFAAVVFTAPSSLDCWLAAAATRREALVGALAKTARVAIGPTTAEHLSLAGLPAAAVAAGPDEGAIGDAIVLALRIDLLP